MSDQDTWIRVPVSLLARVLDSFAEIDCINAGTRDGSIHQQVKKGQNAIAEFLDKHNANSPKPAVIPNCSAMHFMQNHVAESGDETEVHHV